MHARLRGRTLAWDERGRGTPLVLLHAFPLDRRMWRDVIEALALDAHLIAPDFPGLGESEGQVTIDEFADDLAALLDHLGIDRAVIAGLSMGGYAALAFARRHPGRLLGLLLADTRAGADTVEARAVRDAAITRVAAEGPAGYVAEFVPRLVAPASGRARDYASAIGQLQSMLGVAGALAALRDRPDAGPGLAAIAVPTVVVVGSEDTLTPPAEARRLAAGIRDAEVVEIAGVGHLPAIEAPEAFADVARGLLQRVRRVAARRS